MANLLPCFSKELTEAGVDEAGRGCLAGPVVAAAVILKKDFFHPDLNDSKQLSAKQREILEVIIKKEALAWEIGTVDNEKIDEINILNATFLAMNKAVSGLKEKPDLILIDGNRFVNTSGIKHKCIIKGDSIYSSIAAASVLAKTYRDHLMRNFHHEYPVYNWQKNKGYPTFEHRQAIASNGICPYHRKSFQLFFNEKQLKFDF